MTNEQALNVIIPLIIFLIIDLSVLYRAIVQRTRSKTHTQKAFFLFALMVVLQQAFAVLIYSFDYRLLSFPNRASYYLCCGMAIVCLTLASYFWLAYLVLTIQVAKKISIFRAGVLAIPVILISATCISSPWTHWIFYIDDYMTYQQGEMYALQLICPFCYILFAIILAFVFVKRGKSANVYRMLWNFIVFIVPSVIGAFVQVKVCRGGYSQIGLSISLLLIYFEQYIEEINQNEKLKNVAELNEALKQRMSIIQSMGKIYFAAFFVNLKENSFVEINNEDFVRNKIGEKGDAQASLLYVCDNMVKGSTDELRTFVDLSTIDDRLSEKTFITCDYLGKVAGWCQMYIIAGDRNEDGKLKNIFVAARTIHDEKTRELEQSRKIEEARDSAQAQLEEITALNIELQDNQIKLDEAKKAAEAANDAKTSFLFNMSHDIRTPMNAIIGFTELLEKHQNEPEKRADYIRKMEDASAVLLSILNNVLEMSRIEKGTLEIDEAPWEAKQFNDTIFSLFDELMEQKNIKFEAEVNVQHRYVYCDPIKLREIFINILSNAFKYTNPGGTVKMSLEEIPYDKEGWVMYRTVIADTGIGMSEEFLPHVFEEFSRERNTSGNKIEGTGLGMSIVRHLVERLGGRIEVASTKNVGTTFTVFIPHRIADKASIERRMDPRVNREMFKGKRILLAEDNDINAEIATEILTDAGFVVERAEDGEVAVKMVMEASFDYYDLILMDVQMPNLNGYAATRAIRTLEDPKKVNIPIIAMTANAFEEDKREASRAGMNGHLAKPINVEEMMKEISISLKTEIHQ